MTGTAATMTRRHTKVRAGWGYASGRVAVLETMLLPRSFFEGIIASKDIAEARAALSKTIYRAAFPTDAAVRGYAASLNSFVAQWRGVVLRDCPWHVFKNTWELPDRYRAVRAAFLRKAAKGAPGAELAETLSGLASTGQERRALAPHVDMARGRKFASDAVAASLLLDSAEASAAWALAELCVEDKGRTVLVDRAALGTWSSLLRVRWNGASAEALRQWFVVTGMGTGLVEATLSATDADAGAALTGFASRPAVDRLRRVGKEELRADLEKAIVRAMREGVTDARHVAFGPERVISYLASLDIEETNLRISLAAIVEGLDRAGAIARLRGEYV